MHGGVGTINTVLAHAMVGIPIVVAVQSGGAAAAIDAYVHHGIDAIEVRHGLHGCRRKLLARRRSLPSNWLIRLKDAARRTHPPTPCGRPGEVQDAE